MRRHAGQAGVLRVGVVGGAGGGEVGGVALELGVGDAEDVADVGLDRQGPLDLDDVLRRPLQRLKRAGEFADEHPAAAGLGEGRAEGAADALGLGHADAAALGVAARAPDGVGPAHVFQHRVDVGVFLAGDADLLDRGGQRGIPAEVGVLRIGKVKLDDVRRCDSGRRGRRRTRSDRSVVGRWDRGFRAPGASGGARSATGTPRPSRSISQ